MGLIKYILGLYENKTIERTYECELCGIKFIRADEYYFDSLLNMWRPKIYRIHDFCPECITAFEIQKNKNQNNWIKLRKKLLKNKPIKYLNERRYVKWTGK